MYLFVECWKARPEWLALNPEQRGAYMEELGRGMEQLLKSGVEVVSWSINDQDTANRAPFDYVGVWRFPSREAAVRFEKMIEQSGWYTYFDQINLRGEIAMPSISIVDMINL